METDEYYPKGRRITIFMEGETLKQLREMAATQCRDPINQAAWIIREVLRDPELREKVRQKDG